MVHPGMSVHSEGDTLNSLVGMGVMIVAGDILGSSDGLLVELGASLPAAGTCLPPPHEQHASATFFPFLHVFMKESQKGAVT